VTEKQPLDAFQQIAEEMAEVAEADDAKMKQGGKLSMADDLPADSAPQAAGDQPTEAAGSTPDETSTVNQWEVLKDAVPSKWTSAEEAEQSYFHIVKQAREAQKERDALKAQLAGLSTSPREVPVDRAEHRDALKALEDYGVPADVLGEAIKSVAEQTITNFLTPLAKQAEAQQFMQRKYGDAYQKNQQEIEVFLQNDPETKALVDSANVQGQYMLASEYAMLRYMQDKGAKTEVALKANQEVRKQVLDEARKDAGIVTAKRSDGRDKPKDEGLTEERFEKLKDRANMGYPNQLWRETIGATLPKEMFPD
jgi:hypothetical protein